MGSFSDYLELELLDHVLKVGAYTVPTNIYIALSTADPLDDASGLAEPGAPEAYARVLCNVWDAAASRATQNTAAVQFPEATGAWGTITHFAIYDHLTAGNMLAHGSFVASKTVVAGQTLTVAIGEIDVSFLAAGISNYLANALLDHVFKTAAYTPATNLYVALSTVAITDSMSGASISEPIANYARILHNSWNIAAAGATSNNGNVTFVTATTIWGDIVGVAILDHLTAGNLLIYAVLTTAQSLVVGDTAKFPDTTWIVTFD